MINNDCDCVDFFLVNVLEVKSVLSFWYVSLGDFVSLELSKQQDKNEGDKTIKGKSRTLLFTHSLCICS